MSGARLRPILVIFMQKSIELKPKTIHQVYHGGQWVIAEYAERIPERTVHGYRFRDGATSWLIPARHRWDYIGSSRWFFSGDADAEVGPVPEGTLAEIERLKAELARAWEEYHVELHRAIRSHESSDACGRRFGRERRDLNDRLIKLGNSARWCGRYAPAPSFSIIGFLPDTEPRPVPEYIQAEMEKQFGTSRELQAELNRQAAAGQRGYAVIEIEGAGVVGNHLLIVESDLGLCSKMGWMVSVWGIAEAATRAAINAYNQFLRCSEAAGRTQ